MSRILITPSTPPGPWLADAVGLTGWNKAVFLAMYECDGGDGRWVTLSAILGAPVVVEHHRTTVAKQLGPAVRLALQRVRDAGLLAFGDPGHYRLIGRAVVAPEAVNA